MDSIQDTGSRQSDKYIETRLFIHGSFVDAVQGKKFQVVSPTTNKCVAKVSEATEQDVERAVESTKLALPAWSSTDGKETPWKTATRTYCFP